MELDKSLYGPLAFLAGDWTSGEDWKGENVAPAPDRSTENTRFRQEMKFVPIEDVNNHEQQLYGLRYSTFAWEEGDDEDPFHEEVGYLLWDQERKQVMKCFIVPRGVSVIAGGTASRDTETLKMVAELGSQTYGICSNKFLDEEFKTVKYEIDFKFIDENTFSYEEDTHLLMKGRDEVFHHTEKNILKRVVK
jgi:hypothetical protein